MASREHGLDPSRLPTQLGTTGLTEQLLYSKLLPYFMELAVNNELEVCARNQMWCRPRFFTEFVWRSCKEPQKKLQTATLHTEK